jgi:hypothetical protein
MSVDVIVPAPPTATVTQPHALVDGRLRGRAATARQASAARLDAAIEAAMTSQAIWVVPVVILQLVLVLRLDLRAPATAGQLASGGFALAGTVLGYLSTRRLFGQGAALIAAGVFGVAAPGLLAAWSTTATAGGVAVMAAGLCLVSSAARGRAGMVLGLTVLVAGAAVATHSGWHPRYPADRLVLIRREASAIGPLFAAAVAGAVLTRRRRVAASLLAAAAFPVVRQVALGQPAGLHRTLAVSLLLLAPLVGVLGVALLRRGPRLGARVTAGLLCGAVLLATSLTTSDGVVRYLSHPSGISTADTSTTPNSR